MQHTLNQIFAGEEVIRFGTGVIGHDGREQALQDNLPPGFCHTPEEEPRWRYLDRPKRTCEGVILLLPPLSSGAEGLTLWYVTRHGRMLGIFKPTHPLTRQDADFLRQPETTDQEILTFIQQKGRICVNNSKNPISSVVTAHMERYLADLAQRIRATGQEPSPELMKIARQRELWMISIIFGLLRGMLDSRILEQTIRQANGLIPGIYNWLAYPERSGHVPSAQRRLLAYQMNPELVSQHCMVVEDHPELNYPIQALDDLLLDESLTVAQAITYFQRMLDQG